MDLKALCKSHKWQGVTIWMLGYRNHEVDIAINDLEEISPRVAYVNKKTGEKSFTKPQQMTDAEKLADEKNVKLGLKGEQLLQPKTDWVAEFLWQTRENTFAVCLPLIVEIDFPPEDVAAPAEVRVFEAFWNDPSEDFAQRWNVFKKIVGVPTINALWEAYEATRDHVLEAPAALQTEPAADASEEKKDDAPEPSATS